MRKALIATVLGIALHAAFADPASAQTFPDRGVKFIVPFAAGSATDTLARVVAQSASQTLGQPIVVENVPGANGQIAATQVARAEPSGYTILIASNSTHAFNQVLYKKLSYDHVKDFEPISKLGSIALVLVVHPSVPVNSAQELIAYAKAHPGKLSYGAGAASARLSMEMLKSAAGINVLHVPYRSNPQAVTDLLGGQVQMMFADMSTTLPPARAGKLKALAVSTAERSALAPDLPTMRESGITNFELSAWFAAFTPAKTPRNVIATLNRALVKAMDDKGVQNILLRAGIEPSSSSPAELAAFVDSETKKLTEIAKAAGIEPE